ncbi:hypothetical protein EWM64_g9947 [Hericium alpestre]|uniref:AB hydrolase-1 domain-containing protein n=1 Tax=Hericium alpestre TaxID=135208 RepID=A0A4Y9ZH47_9AGAM|nr:hypothetical protein EWM64_g9947 [Hericium alpestre]
MPTATVNDRGIQFYYEDSGPLIGSYLTVVMVHGIAFNAAIYQLMFSAAEAHGLRIVAINRRDYPGSTPMSDDDITANGSPDNESWTEFFRQRAFEIGEFLAWFAQTQDIPKFSESETGKAEGGIALVSWSAGIRSTMGLMGFADRLPENTGKALDPYFRAFCLLDCPQSLLGIEAPGLYNPFYDFSLGDERFKTFFAFIDAHYDHADIHSGDVSTLTMQPRSTSPGTLTTMMPEEKGKVITPVTSRSELLITPGPVYYAMIKRMADKSTSDIWPRCKLKVFTCENSVWETVCSPWGLEKLCKEKERDGTLGKAFEMDWIPEGNHFDTALRYMPSVIDIIVIELIKDHDSGPACDG